MYRKFLCLYDERLIFQSLAPDHGQREDLLFSVLYESTVESFASVNYMLTPSYLSVF